MMQANNQAVGSPTNRINMLAHWSADGLKLSMPASSVTLRQIGLLPFIRERAHLLIFRCSLFAVDIGFFLTQVRQWVLAKTGSKRDEGFEDVLQRQVTVRCPLRAFEGKADCSSCRRKWHGTSLG